MVEQIAPTVNKSILLTVRASFLQIKHWNIELEVKVQQDIKIYVMIEIKAFWTITEIRGGLNSSNGQSVKLVYRSSIIFLDRLLEH